MKKAVQVRLGFEVGTGDEVSIPLHHLIVTGTTQLSGKTTTLEGLISRADQYASLMFRTKRGEADFDYANPHLPYYSDRCDWQYVQSILEATMRERLKFERSWIIRACKNASTLYDVYINVVNELQTARGLSQSVYTNLKAYLDIVIPQVRKTEFANSVELQPGLNVMDLVELSEEMQALIIASSLENIHKFAENTICVVPEAWKFLPQGRSTPVQNIIEKLSREGAGIGNYVWLDSQDITGVDKGTLKNFDIWILGRQRETNEIQRTLSQVPVPKKDKPKPEAIASLLIGNFFACAGNHVRKVYVQPAWLPVTEARQIAITGAMISDIDVFRPKPKEKPDMSYDQKMSDLEKRNEKLEAEVKRLTGELREAKQGVMEAGETEPVGGGKAVNMGPIDINATERAVTITTNFEKRDFQTTGPRGMIMYILCKELRDPSKEGEIADAMREHGWNYGHSTMAPELAKLVKNGDLITDGLRPAKYRVPGKLKISVDGKEAK